MTAFLCIPVAEGHALDFLRTILTPNQAGEFDADVLPLAQVSPFPQETQTPASSKDTQWSEVLPRLWTYLRDDTKAIMVFIAERAGERVTIASLEDEFGGFRKVQAALASLTKRMTTASLPAGTKWPFLAWKDDSTDRFSYMMDVDIASIVLGLAGE